MNNEATWTTARARRSVTWLIAGVLALVAVPGICPLLQAGAPGGSIVKSAPSGNGDWCTWLADKPGTLYKNDNPWIQEIGVFGRFQWQAAYLAGNDINGYGFNDAYNEIRRARLGTQIKFLRYFGFKANATLVDDTRAYDVPWPGNYSLGWGYEEFDTLRLRFDAAKGFGIDSLDELKISYGRHKPHIGVERHTSSKKLLTVERSVIANKIDNNPTAVSLDWAKGRWSGDVALLSTDALTRFGGDLDALGGWNDGLAYYASVGYDATDELDLLFDFLYNDADTMAGEDSLIRLGWISSVAATWKFDRWGLISNLFYGDNGDLRNGVILPARQGDFWGLVIMPHFWIVNRKLEGVARYAYAGSHNAQGVRTYSRYVRRSHGPVVRVNRGFGNEHQSIYGGLNYYICGHNAKIQAGIEYQYLNSPGAGTDGNVNATTFWFAVRTYF